MEEVEWARAPRVARAGKRPCKGRGEADIVRRRRRRRWYSGKSKARIVPHTIDTGGVGAPRGRRLLIEGHARHRLRVERDNADTAGGVPRSNAGSATNWYRKGAKHYSQGRSRLWMRRRNAPWEQNDNRTSGGFTIEELGDPP